MKLKVLPLDKEFEITPDETVKDVCDRNGVFVKSICKGIPSCAECRVHIVEGDHNLLSPSVKELSLIGTGHFIDRRRLACQMRCFGDVVIDVSEQIAKEKEDIELRRPQGVIKKEMSEVSMAVSGSLLEQEGQLEKEMKKTPEGQRNRPNRKQKGSKNSNSSGSKGSQSKSKHKTSPGQSEGESNDKGGAKKRNRNRKRRGPRPKSSESGGKVDS